MAKYFWIGLLVVIGMIVVSVVVIDVAAPNVLWDALFNHLGKVDVRYQGRTIDVEFVTMGAGIDERQRTWVIKKTHAFKYYAELHPESAPALDAFVELLVAAGADRQLTASEYAALAASHRDLITDEIVEDWLKLAHETQ
jgi:hypothetical protein